MHILKDDILYPMCFPSQVHVMFPLLPTSSDNNGSPAPVRTNSVNHDPSLLYHSVYVTRVRDVHRECVYIAFRDLGFE